MIGFVKDTLIRYRYSDTEEETNTEKVKRTLENVYENIRAKFASAMLKMRTTLQSPGYRDLIFYVVLSKGGFPKKGGKMWLPKSLSDKIFIEKCNL